ncbi:MAG: HAD family hydrolase [Nitrososphaeria archaeon]|jgi:putative hydrolase of the HAD superfamily
MIKAVLFDLGGTLIKGNEITQVIKMYDNFLQTFGLKRSQEEIVGAYEKANDRENVKMFLHSSRGFWIEFNDLFLSELKVKKKKVEIAKVIDREWWCKIKLSFYPDVLPTLDALRRRNLKIGIISNGLENDIEQILKLANESDLEQKYNFDVKVGIDTFKSLKPDKEIFLLTLKKLDLSASEVLYVGDSLRNDYEGAENVGIYSLLIDREDSIKVEGVRKVLDLRMILKYL